MVATARSVKPSRDDDILVVPGDIADRKTAERAISEGVARFGRIDTLVMKETPSVERIRTAARRAARRFNRIFPGPRGTKAPKPSRSRPNLLI